MGILDPGRWNVLRALRLLQPQGMRLAVEYGKRFGALGLDPRSWRDPALRTALETSSVELLPPSARRNPGIVVDVGANRGTWTNGIAALIGGERFFAYEPNPTIYSELEAATRHLSITLRQAAVGAERGTVALRAEQVDQLSSVLPLRPELRAFHGSAAERTRLFEVPLVTLDEELVAIGEVGILKIDVQGFEREVLRGAREVLRRTRVLMIEMLYRSYYTGDATFEELHFDLTKTHALSLYVVGPPRCDARGEPLWADAIYVNRRLED